MACTHRMHRARVHYAMLPYDPPPTAQPPAWVWDIFCTVVDNFGDIGVCWRLSCQLAAQGQRVRLWVDDASALAWMAPQGCAGVEVKSWHDTAGYTAGHVLIEAFGCSIEEGAPEIIAACAAFPWASGIKDLKNSTHSTVWINLEYLSAEPYVQRCHGLASPVRSGPGAGMTKWFFYPGFTQGTGGLLAGPPAQPANSLHTKPAQDLPHTAATALRSQRISLFCYEPPALAQLLHQLAHGAQPTQLLVTHGRASAALRQALQSVEFLSKNTVWPKEKLNEQLLIPEQLHIDYLPSLSQNDYDGLLGSCQLNCVRGEDSLARALWAGQPLVWHIYPQDDGAHAAKLDAFLDWLDAPADLRLFHHVWNGLSPLPLPALNLPLWRSTAQRALRLLHGQRDLVQQLREFVAQKA